MNSRASHRACFYDYCAIMGFDDAVAIGKAETRAVGPRCEKRIEEVLSLSPAKSLRRCPRS